MARGVLVVDDDPLVLVTAAMLDNLGCDVVTASTRKEALTLLAAHQRIEILIPDNSSQDLTAHSAGSAVAGVTNSDRKQIDMRSPLPPPCAEAEAEDPVVYDFSGTHVVLVLSYL